MPLRFLLPPLVLGLGVLAAAPAPDKAAKADAAAVARLVTQLGSRDFDDREKASAALEAIGEPALDALREAMKSPDAEVSKLAESLVGKIEKRLEPMNALTAKRVHLVFKDTPVKDAVEDLKKKTGYDITLADADDKLKDRTVTLDTGDVTFWQAFASFCEAAGLKEPEARRLVSVAPLYPGPPFEPTIAVEQITFIDGKWEGGPTDAVTAVRLRALPPVTDAAPADDTAVALLLSLEPRLQWVSIEKVSVAKAVDDQKQELTPTATDFTLPNPKQTPPVILVGENEFIGGGIYREAVIHWKKGPKAARSLTELRGTVHATILGEMSAVITASDILNAGGKTFKGGEDGQFKVIDASKDDHDRITIRVELRPPSGFVTLNGQGVPAGVAKGVAAVPDPDGRFLSPGLGWGSGNGKGLGLLDDKGNSVKGGITHTEVRGEATPAGRVNRFTYTLVFQLEKGRETSELVFSGRKVLDVDIPFTLKDVALP